VNCKGDIYWLISVRDEWALHYHLCCRNYGTKSKAGKFQGFCKQKPDSIIPIVQERVEEVGT